MNTLVVGHRRETRALARLIRSRDRQSTCHFPDALAALAALRQSGSRFDFALLEGEEDSAGIRELTEAIRQRNRQAPIAFLSYAVRSRSAAADRPRLLGAFERSPRGLRILNCILAEPYTAPEGGNCAYDIGNVIFEYQAPGKRREDLND